jgi:hypothetical protein
MTKKEQSIFQFLRSPNYDPERDGSLGEYLFSKENPSNGSALFRGEGDFRMLKDRKLLLPGITSVRVMWSFGRDDEHYIVDENFNLLGITSIGAHQGNEGIHTPNKIFKRTVAGKEFSMRFELQNPDYEVVQKLKDQGI